MQVKTLSHHFVSPPPNPIFRQLSQSSISINKSQLFSHGPSFHCSFFPSKQYVLKPKNHHSRFITACIGPSQELEFSSENESKSTPLSLSEEEKEEKVVEVNLANQSVWNQMKEILMFTGPATALWICGPLMSLIDTAVVGQGSSIELAALGPGTVFCDDLSYMFMFLSIATSNMVATSLTRQDKNGVQHQISILLFVGLVCGILMLLFTKFFGLWALTAFTGAKNVHLLPAANTYVQIRGLAWPAVLIGWVTQSASLGMKDSWGPLKALAVASAVNGIGDIVFCRFFKYGIAGAAWTTMVSQVIAAYMMIDTLNKKGYNAFTVSVPSSNDLLEIFEIAAPLFLMTISKVAFYTLIIYFATSMGTITLAAHQASYTLAVLSKFILLFHSISMKGGGFFTVNLLFFQVLIQTFMICTVCGEPLSQTAQSFMPEFLYGANRNLAKARMLLKSLVIIGAILGLFLGVVGTSVPWLFPNIFTPDQAIIREMHKVLVPFFITLAVTPCILSLEGTLLMHKVLLPYFLALAVTPSIHSLEGTLLAGRDLKFISLSMSGCFLLGGLVLLLVSSRGYGLTGCWFALTGFQWARFFLSLWRVLSSDGILFSKDLSRYTTEKVKAA